MNRSPGNNGWTLEVVRGRTVGHVYALPAGEVVLGNAVGSGGGSSIDLSEQEGASPRRMAARQAVIENRGAATVLRDLDSPGGTFVNRRRILPGQDQTLKPGDLIQLGGVQLRVVAGESAPRSTMKTAKPSPAATASPAAPPPRPQPAATPSSQAAAPLAYRLKDGPICRSWDDFLAVSAQRWGDLRDELTSGRLAGYLASIGRSAQAPKPDAPGSPDDRLDAWLASLPTTRPGQPEVDVHPRSIVVRANPGGGSTRRSIHVSNVGYRLLRSKVRVEPPDTTWLAVPETFTRSFATVEETEVPIEVIVPESYSGRLSAAVVVEGNGGSARVSVVLERSTGSQGDADLIAGAGAVEGPASSVSLESIGSWVSARLSKWSAPGRLIGGAVGGLAFRLLIGAACGLTGVATLPGPAALLAAMGALGGLIGAGRRGGWRDAPAGAFAGGFAGLVMASAAVAACQAVEPILGASLSGNLLAVAVLWTVIGIALGGVSIGLVPPSPRSKEAEGA